MLKNRLKGIVRYFVSLLFIALAVSFSVMGAESSYYNGVTIENGKFTGISPMFGDSEYTYITLENFVDGTGFSNIDVSSNTFYTVTDDTVITENGIVYLRLKTKPAHYAFFYHQGENGIERAEIGYKDNEFLTEGSSSLWKSGVWTSQTDIYTGNKSFYLSSESHIGISKTQSIYNGFTDGDTKNGSLSNELRLDAISAIEAQSYKYAYESHEIIPVSELYSITYKTNVRQGSLYVYSPSGEALNTKLVLYTMDDKGNVTTHTWFDPASYATYNKTLSGIESTHTAIIENAFPYATGYVIGFEVFPFGDLPDDVQFKALFNEGATYEFIPTQFSVEFIPSGYTTKWINDSTKLPFEYNGANKRYIYGYADGTFKPDARISRAEISTIVSRLLLDTNNIPVSFTSTYTDITPDDWHYTAIAYLEKLGIFNYIEGEFFYPDSYITRGEFARILYNASGVNSFDGIDGFDDTDISHPHYTAIATLEKLGIIKGYPDKTFRPNAPVSRAEAVTMINRVINLTVDGSYLANDLEYTFEDIEGHWAKGHILVASNNNVKTLSHHNLISCLSENEERIEFETVHVKVSIEKESGKVREIINKYTNENVISTSVAPWFSTMVSVSGINYVPTSASIENGRLKIEFEGGYKAYFLVETFDNYFTVELDSELPYNVSYIDFASLSIVCETDNYRISAVPMTTTVDPVSFPGGASKRTVARVFGAIGDVIGAKVGITFSEFGGVEEGAHRKYLKEISANIDDSKGLTSTHGGAFTYDEGNEDLFGDYVVLHGGITPSNATEIANMASKYSVDQIDLHQGSSAFVQGEFNFVCAKESGDGSFISASLFKDRVSTLVHDNGIKLGLHTYASIIDPASTTILSNPKWQRQLMYYPEDIITLSSDISSTDTTIYSNEGIEGREFISTSGNGCSYNASIYSQLILVDEEIMRVTAYNTTTGKMTVKRGMCGTEAAFHDQNSEIRQLLCIYDGLQPIVGSELFWHVADLTAKAYNDGGFDMIYLDGIEGILNFSDSKLKYYYYSEFMRRIISQCKTKPIMEASDNPASTWASRGRSGAMDYPSRQYKKFNTGHVNSNKDYLYRYQTSTLGWFNFAPVPSASPGYNYPNTFVKTIFRDDIDHLGVLAVAHDMSMAYESFTLDSMTHNNELIENITYFDKYSYLRKNDYFSDKVKKTLTEGLKNGKEYKLISKDGEWGFYETYYSSSIIRNISDKTSTDTNPYDVQTPYIRIEQRYSALPDASEAILLNLGDGVSVSSVKGIHNANLSNITSSRALKVKVSGNGSESDAILISLKDSADGRIDYFIPLNFTGEQDFILIDADNADFDGFEFAGINSKPAVDYTTYRTNLSASSVATVTISLTGECDGVTIGDIRVCSPVNAPASNPTIKVGDSEITFNTTLNSGEYLEYLPEENKAYKYYYKSYSYTNSNGGVSTLAYQKYTDDVEFSGEITIPAGEFSYTYSSEGTNDAPLRAKITIGLKSNEFLGN